MNSKDIANTRAGSPGDVVTVLRSKNLAVVCRARTETRGAKTESLRFVADEDEGVVVYARATDANPATLAGKRRRGDSPDRGTFVRLRPATATQETRRERREAENRGCIGGLSRPARSLARDELAGLREGLKSVRGILKGVLRRHPTCIAQVAALLKGRAAKSQQEAEAQLREDLPQPAIAEAAKALGLLGP